MDYKDALDFIHMSSKFGSKLGLDNIKVLLSMLGNPHENLKVIHIAGTNGKGSTSTMLSYILTENGYKTGLYISPFLEVFNERIQINNKNIANNDLAKYVSTVRNAIDKMKEKGYSHPTEFEIITATAFLYFRDKNTDIVILEVGMGGRLDATNVIDCPLASVITSISLDHTQYLGKTVKEITFEKAGIIKENSDCVVYPNDKEVIKVIKNAADKKHAKLYMTNKNDIKIINHSLDGMELCYKKENNLGITNFSLGLRGINQSYNSLVVLKVLELINNKGFKLDKLKILDGFKKVYFRGRFEVLHKNPYIIIDGGHNEDGIKSFVENVKYYFGDKKVVLFFGMLKDKDIKTSAKLLSKITENIYTLTPNNPNAKNAKELNTYIKENYSGIKSEYIESINDIINHIDMNKKDEIYAVTGSLYLIGEVRKIIENNLKY